MQEQLISSLSSEDPSLPSTPTSDAPSKRLSWSKLMQKLHSSQSLDSDSDNHSSTDDASDAGSISLADLSESDLFFDPAEEALCKEVVQLIALNLTDAKDGVLHCSKLLIPEKLLEHIGQELVHLSVSEPCGLRGALVDLCVEQDGSCEAVGQIAVDPYLVPTFQLTLVLRLDSRGFWPKIQGLFAGRSPSSPAVRRALKLSTGFRVIKRKLYSSEELLIEEC
ncbi:DNA damage-inducible transcript 4 protein [Puntigrus tetrazona]|uniref:DNA damage-inducible transcript 4 protein n=1 Tax=Puntigrus tetrazona TaxID=1606681 RepID=UPI001C89D72D|nr:DNA damage-inducible transcript 4 protein [Puntigrus tetrazona]